MSRTTLCGATAAGLVAVSLALMISRHQVLGEEVRVPKYPGTWKVSMLVRGKATSTDARLLTATPLDFGHQHILGEAFRSADMVNKPPDAKHPQRREVVWAPRAGSAPAAFQVLYEFYCVMDMHHPTGSMSKLTKALYAPPLAGEYLNLPAGTEADQQRVALLARQLTEGIEQPADQAQALFRYVGEVIRNEPTMPGPDLRAAACLKNGSGDSRAKSRLLLTMLRHRGIPARRMTGLALGKGPEQTAHSWVEAWIHNHWLPLCPFYRHFGRVPPSYLVFGVGDVAMVRGRQVRDVDYGFLVERVNAADQETALSGTPLRRFLLAFSLHGLPPAEQRLVELLLLLPIGALMVCIYRNVIGLNSFGTFAPAIIGLAFRDLHSLPGLLVFVSIVLVGWMMRRFLDYYRLLQVPRTAFLLSLVVIVLIGAIVVANSQSPHLGTTQYVSLFPMVILTGMIERFWTLETEDSTASSFRTLLATMWIAASIALVLSIRALVNHMFHYPETLGIIMAIQLLLGRYTGYKVSEIWRFRDFLSNGEQAHEVVCHRLAATEGAGHPGHELSQRGLYPGSQSPGIVSDR
jgi:hypothetical protein